MEVCSSAAVADVQDDDPARGTVKVASPDEKLDAAAAQPKLRQHERDRLPRVPVGFEQRDGLVGGPRDRDRVFGRESAAQDLAECGADSVIVARRPG